MGLRSTVTAGTLIVLLTAGYQAAQPAARPPAQALTVTAPGMPANEQLANRMAAALHQWDGRQQACLDKLWDRESAHTWSATVVNPISGAYGIVQSLPAGKLADPAQGGGPDWRTNPATQIRWGLAYIAGRYGTPCAAWAHELAASWY
jgi:hypothetical protein